MMKVALIGLGSVGRGVAGMIAKKDLGISITGIADSQSGFHEFRRDRYRKPAGR